MDTDLTQIGTMKKQERTDAYAGRTHLRLRSPQCRASITDTGVSRAVALTLLMEVDEPIHLSSAVVLNGVAVELTRAEAIELRTLLGDKLGLRS